MLQLTKLRILRSGKVTWADVSRRRSPVLRLHGSLSWWWQGGYGQKKWSTVLQL